MGKLLFFIVIGLVVFLLLKKKLSQRPQGDAPNKTSDIENMVKCAHCGVNLPRSEAIFSQGEFFCTPEHRLLKQK